MISMKKLFIIIFLLFIGKSNANAQNIPSKFCGTWGKSKDDCKYSYQNVDIGCNSIYYYELRAEAMNSIKIVNENECIIYFSSLDGEEPELKTVVLKLRRSDEKLIIVENNDLKTTMIYIKCPTTTD
jgi:hypothetical protein